MDFEFIEKHDMTGVNLHGEAKEIDKEKRIATMSKWYGKFSTTLKEIGVGPGCVYNADQTGLYYIKLPNCLYVPIENCKNYKRRKTD